MIIVPALSLALILVAVAGIWMLKNSDKDSPGAEAPMENKVEKR